MVFFSPLRPLLKGWLLSAAAWSMAGLAMAAYGVTMHGDTWSQHLEPSLRYWLPWAVVTPLLFRLVSRLPLDRQHRELALPVHLLCAGLVLFGAHWWKTHFRVPGGDAFRPPFAAREAGARGAGPASMDRARMNFPPGPPPDFARSGSEERSGGWRGPRGPGPGPGWRGQFDLFSFMAFDLPLYVMILAGAHAVFFFRRDQERAATLARARLDALRMQLQPHFLFNTLNTIAGLVHEEPDKADAMLTALSELLRMSLRASTAQEIPLADELTFLERYLQLMHARFEERLRYEIDTRPELAGAMVPPMLLQPLVENAVEHGVEPKPRGGTVRIHAWSEGEVLHLAVEDDGAGVPEGSEIEEGIGLSNTRARLRQLYGRRASLGIRTGGGTIAEITLPLTLAGLHEKLPLAREPEGPAQSLQFGKR